MRTGLFLFLLLPFINVFAANGVKSRSPKEWREDLVAAVKKTAESEDKRFSASDEDRLKLSFKAASEDLEELSTFISTPQLKQILNDTSLWTVEVNGKEKALGSKSEALARDEVFPLVNDAVTKKVLQLNKRTILKTSYQLLDFLKLVQVGVLEVCNQTYVDKFKNNFHTQEEKSCFFYSAYKTLEDEQPYFRPYLRRLIKEVWSSQGSTLLKEGFLKHAVPALIVANFVTLPPKLRMQSSCHSTRFRTNELDAVLHGYNDCVNSMRAITVFQDNVGFKFE